MRKCNGRDYYEVPKLFAGFSQKVSKRGLTNEIRGGKMLRIKAKASLSVNAQIRYFTFRNQNKFIYEEGKDVFNVVGNAPTVKGVFSFFIKEETVCRM